MTTLAELDPILREWSSDNRIPVFTHYKDEDVRSFQVVGPSGAQSQIGIEADDRLTVSVWDYRKRRQDFEADLDSLRAQLDEALRVARSWVGL